MSSRRHKFRQQQGQRVETPLPQQPKAVDPTPPPPAKPSFFKRYWHYGAAATVALILWFVANVVLANDEVPVLPSDDVTEVTAIEPEEIEVETTEEKPSKFGKAMRYLFKDDSSAIVTEAEADYQERVAALDARERDLAELERIVREEEAALTQELADAEAAKATVDGRIKALTQCVATAMEEAPQ